MALSFSNNLYSLPGAARPRSQNPIYPSARAELPTVGADDVIVGARSSSMGMADETDACAGSWGCRTITSIATAAAAASKATSGKDRTSARASATAISTSLSAAGAAAAVRSIELIIKNSRLSYGPPTLAHPKAGNSHTRTVSVPPGQAPAAPMTARAGSEGRSAAPAAPPSEPWCVDGNRYMVKRSDWPQTLLPPNPRLVPFASGRRGTPSIHDTDSVVVRPPRAHRRKNAHLRTYDSRTHPNHDLGHAACDSTRTLPPPSALRGSSRTAVRAHARTPPFGQRESRSSQVGYGGST